MESGQDLVDLRYLSFSSQFGESWKENCESSLSSHLTSTQPAVQLDKEVHKYIDVLCQEPTPQLNL